MLKLDNNLLQELGLGLLPDDQKKAMLQHIYDTLELRVGTQLANQMTDQQLSEFEQFIDAGGDASQAQALQWLETNLPNYKQVVNEVFEALKVEVKQMAPQLMASIQQVPPSDNPAPQVAPQQYQQSYVDPAQQNYASPQPQYAAIPPAPTYPQQQAQPALSAQPPQGYYQQQAVPPQYQQPQAAVAPQQQVPPSDNPAPQVAPQQYQPQQTPSSAQFPTQQPPAGPGV